MLRKMKISLSIPFLAVVACSIQLSSQAERIDCGMMGSDSSIGGTNFAGYWQTTFGLMHLVRLGPNTLEGASTASGYLRGNETGTNFTGRFAEDTGSYHTGTAKIDMTQGGHCMKGTLTFDDGAVDEVIGMRVPRPSMPYTKIYELTGRIEHLKHLIGGVLNLSEMDGPDFLPNRAAGATQQIMQAGPNHNPPATSQSDVQAETPTDDPESHEDNHERPEGYQ